MERYKNIDGDSGVIEYEYGTDYIRVKFSTGATYLYTYGSAGSYHIDNMKILARRGDGLNAYINANVRKNYEKKER